MTDAAAKFRYVALADDLERQIAEGVYRGGDRLPSIRTLHRERALSMSTVNQALAELERRGLVQARARSGYFVAPARRREAPALQRHRMRPRRVPLPHLADDFVTASADPGLVPLGGAVLSPELLPLKQLCRITRDVSQRVARAYATYGPPAGAPELRRQIAKRMLELGLGVTPDEVVVSSGCMDAIRLALLAVAKPGDVVAVESPTFFGFLQLVRDFGFYALEIPTDPRTGIDLASLQRALQAHEVKALIVTPNFHNPTGAVLPDEHKREVGRLARRHRVTVIEDDIYGDLYFGDRRPTPLAAVAEGADVLYCSSFSKNLAPGLRVGWVLPGRHLDRVRRLKLSSMITSPALDQLVIAEFLEMGSFDRHLRRLRGQLKSQMSSVLAELARGLPRAARVTDPEGGFLVWVDLGADVDTLELYERARRVGVSILPGALCAVDAKHRARFRVSCGYPFDDRMAAGIERFLRLVESA